MICLVTTEEKIETPESTFPDSVTHIKVADKDVYLIGTAHVSQESVNDVTTTIQMVEPDSICVELCELRYNNITNPDTWKKMNIVKVIKEGKSMFLLSSLIMTSFQKRIAKQLGVKPGAEMIEGINQAKAIGAELVLADRDIQITLKRTWGNLGLWSKSKIVFQLMASVFVTEDIDEQMVEDLKKQDQLTMALQTIGEEFPQVKSTLIDERDVYLAQKIRTAPGQKVVAVLGAGHVPGISELIHQTIDLHPLEQLPKPSAWPNVLKWGIPAVIIAIFIYGFFMGGADKSKEMVYIWFLVNGILSAAGAALALGHPLTILSAFIAAPLTSLNPTIAAGWVSGLVQAWVKKPTVEDLENLPEDIGTIKGFWFNPVSRILLVAALSNLGSMFGTFIAGSWIAGKVFNLN